MYTLLNVIEREGRVRSIRVPHVNSKTLRPAIVEQVSRKFYLMTDESTVYPKIGREFAGLGVTDDERAAKALKGIVGKRLTYRRTGQGAAS